MPILRNFASNEEYQAELRREKRHARDDKKRNEGMILVRIAKDTNLNGWSLNNMLPDLEENWQASHTYKQWCRISVDPAYYVYHYCGGSCFIKIDQPGVTVIE
jgi:hypothetical protein